MTMPCLDIKKSNTGLTPNRTKCSPEKPSQEVVKFFNSRSVLNKNQAMGLSRGVIANQISNSTATFPDKTVPLPTVKLPNLSSLKKLTSLVKVTPWVAVVTSVFSMDSVGLTPEEEERILGKSRAKSSILSEKDAKLLGQPSAFPIMPPEDKKPMGGFETYQGDSLSKLENPAFNNNQTIHSTFFPNDTNIPSPELMQSGNEKEKKEREKKIDKYLLGSGHSVVKNPLEGVNGAGRQGDRYIDDKLTEYKTIKNVKNITSDGLSGAISKAAMRGRGQAPNIIIDTREQVGMTEEIAKRGIERAYGADKYSGKITEIRVIGKNFDLSVSNKR